MAKVALSSLLCLEKDRTNEENSMKKMSQDCSILLVEDNEDDIFITKRAFERGNIRNKLYVVRDGEKAMNFLRKIGKYKDAPRPIFILLDLKMPNFNGFEVLKEVKKDSDLKKIPVIVLTTSGRNQDVERAYYLGCNSYIVKPMSFEKFIGTVTKIQKYWLTITRTPFY
jgi:CheY-like chemotaxis protein